MKPNSGRTLFVLGCLIGALACAGGNGDTQAPGGRSGRGGGGPGGMPAGGGGRPAVAAVPVEVITASRQAISSFIETNGTLEAENEVDLVARTAAPIVALLVEEGDVVRAGQLLARLDDVELRVQSELARVDVAETKQAYDRAQKLRDEDLISPEAYEQAVSAHDSALAQVQAAEIQLAFTQLRAPFDGRIVRRYVDPAEQVSVNAPVYRLSDFDPLLCPIQVPERVLPRIERGQQAWVQVEAWQDERFPAKVLRISPIVEAETGTVKVTLDLEHAGKLRPGMFARVFVETERRENVVVVPKAALSLESIGDTVYVAADGVASRREVTLGFRQGDQVQVLSGIEEGEQVVVVGQDGLSEGTPLQILEPRVAPVAQATDGTPSRPGSGPAAAGSEDGPARSAGRGKAPGGRGRPDFANMTDEQLEQVKARMRSMGMTDEQIEERIKRRREAAANGE